MEKLRIIKSSFCRFSLYFGVVLCIYLLRGGRKANVSRYISQHSSADVIGAEGRGNESGVEGEKNFRGSFPPTPPPPLLCPAHYVMHPHTSEHVITQLHSNLLCKICSFTRGGDAINIYPLSYDITILA